VPAKTARIQDASLRESLEQAHASLRSGDYTGVVRRASDAYLQLLARRPELLEGPARVRSLLFFPRLGARLELRHDGTPEVIYDREKFTFSEAVTYYEFAVDALVKNGI
jgi:hypothetical protein